PRRTSCPRGRTGRGCTGCEPGRGAIPQAWPVHRPGGDERDPGRRRGGPPAEWAASTHPRRPRSPTASSPAPRSRPGSYRPPTTPAPPGSTGTIGLPPGPVTSAELAAAVPDARDRRRYRRIWHGMYRREDQVDDLALRTAALACAWPDGVLRGRSAALLWGDDTAPA